MSNMLGRPDPRDAILQHLQEMRAFAMSLTRNPSSADDLVQDSIVKAWRKFHQFDQTTNLRAWLFTIVRNTFYSDLRKSRRELSNIENTDVEEYSDGGGTDQIIAVMDFEKAFSILPTEQREALTLVAASGMSYEEAAATCGIAIGTIKSRVNRGRKRLADILERNGLSDIG
ncbi:sigma-70 family RNA polymerase sigma factor [Yoonia sediminilitoris]|uniref:RNA polymerase sigma factor n=1 Tax=Yoonia sediminilitoris TaxID=1286148 RepID=A0A2T6KB19_9RHOB|nr:sigma-70 family RNA polymerase sigma factor [Yoonia sediminilitoris]PUB12074.1 RNA polymerase sigma-70 factor (ECF subfamily) [Yoonia sediminilitoris]RCW92901.1 RNA polymerase sigma-70 factor (ECF subfamily) [Yoonia sediminilitoris]